MGAIGDRVKKLRDKLQMTQVEFGAKLGVTGGVVSAWESGKAPVPYGRALIICETFGVNESWLTSGLGKMFVVQASNEIDARKKAQEYVVSLLKRMPTDVRDDVLAFCRSVLKRF